MTDISRLRAVKRSIEDSLLAIPGVTGVDIEDGAIVAFVEEKKPLAELPEDERIPSRVDGVRIRVREMTPEPQTDAVRAEEER